MSRKERKAGTLRSDDGEILDYPDIPTVQEWIVQGRVDRSYQIRARGRKRWRSVIDIPELAAFIHLREASAPWEQAHSVYVASLGS